MFEKEPSKYIVFIDTRHLDDPPRKQHSNAPNYPRPDIDFEGMTYGRLDWNRSNVIVVHFDG